MKNEKKNQGNKRMVSFVVIPLVVIIMIGLIVALDRGKGHPTAVGESGEAAETSLGTSRQDGSGEGETSAENALEEASEAESAEEESGSQAEQSILSQDSNPEILALLNRYFTARADGDAETMESVYGKSGEDSSQTEQLRSELKKYSRYLVGFEHVTTYVAAGEEENSWVVYATADIRFYTADTAAPMIMWCYVKADDSGAYYMVEEEDMTEDELQYVNVLNHSEEVRQLASSVNVALKEALESDQDLNDVYGVLRAGSPVWEEENGPDVVVEGAESSGAEETEGGESSAESDETGSESGESVSEARESSSAAESSPQAQETAAGQETAGNAE